MSSSVECYLCLEPIQRDEDLWWDIPRLHLWLGWSELPRDQWEACHADCGDDLYLASLGVKGEACARRVKNTE